MSRAITKALGKLEKWVTTTKSRQGTIAQGNGTPGTRAAPTRAGNNDAKLGCRLDFGEVYVKGEKKYQRYYLQLNKQAEDSTIQKLAQKNSHQNWSYADVEIKENPTEEDKKEASTSLFEQLEENLED